MAIGSCESLVRKARSHFQVAPSSMPWRIATGHIWPLIVSLAIRMAGRSSAPRAMASRRSAHWRQPAGPPEPSTQIYEGTNQIQRVVIAKGLLG